MDVGSIFTTLVVVCLSAALLPCRAIDRPVHSVVDIGWIRVTQIDKGWVVARSYHHSYSGESILPGDVILSVDRRSVVGANALNMARILSRIPRDADTVELLRNGVSKRLQLFPVSEPLVKQAVRFTFAKAEAARDAGLPSGALPDRSGQMHTFQYGPKWTLIHIWSTFCPGCWRDVAALNEISKPFPNSLAVVVVAIEDDADTLKQFSQRQPIEFVNLLGGKWKDQFAKNIGVPAIPADVLVDPSVSSYLLGVAAILLPPL
jgi:AhpC/TSA family